MPFSDQSALHTFADRLAELSPLAEPERSAILGLTGHVGQARANVDIVSPSQAVEHVCLVVEGLVGRFGQLRDGKRQITALHIAGDMANLHSVATPAAACAMQALAVSTIIRIPVLRLRRIATEHPAIAQAFWAYSAVDAAILSQWTVNVGRRAAQARLAHLFCEIALRMERAGQGDRHAFNLDATQIQLADALGLTPVHVNRTLRALREAQVVAIDGRTIRIANWERLVALGDFDPDYLQIEPPMQRAA